MLRNTIFGIILLILICAVSMHKFLVLVLVQRDTSFLYCLKLNKSISRYGFSHQTPYSSLDDSSGDYDHYINSHLLSKFIPIVDIGSDFIRHSDLIPRTAYFDNRVVNREPRNMIVILAEVSKSILNNKLIISCKISNEYSLAVEVVPDPIMKWVETHKSGYTHYFALIYCSGLPESVIYDGNSMVQVIYKTKNDGLFKSVTTEYPLRVTNNDNVLHKRNNLVVICTTMYDHPARFDEWLRYVKTIGIDMVHINAQVSFAINMTFYPFLIESLSNGFVQIQVWKNYLQKQIFYYSQSLLYQDCVMQYRDSFKFAMMIDYDDFFIPVIPTEINIRYYLSKFFSDDSVASIRLPWIQYHCEPMNNSEIIDGNVTLSVSRLSLNKRLESKSIHRLSAVDIVSIHRVYTTLPGSEVQKINGTQTAYIAHIRPNKDKCN